MNTNAFSANATTLVAKFGTAAHHVIGLYREGGERLADTLDQRWKAAMKESAPKLTAETARAVNTRLIQSERQLTDPAGLPRRPWYRHLLYAPGYYTGYAVKTIPGVREAIEQKSYVEAETEIARVARALDRERTLLDSASADLERVK